MSIKDKIIEHIKEVEAIPTSATNAIALLQAKEVDINKVIKAIEIDISITANLLKLVNSSAFAADRKISSVQEAVVRIGAKNLMQMLIGSSVTKALNVEIKGYDLPPGELWKSSIVTAIYSDVIKEELSINLPAWTFTAGLLRDVGKIVLGSFIDYVNPDDIIAHAKKNEISFVEAEKEILGIDHAEVGALLLRQWKLPQQLEIPVRYHHTPEEIDGVKYPEEKVVAEIIHIADSLTIMQGIGVGREGLNYRVSDKIAEKYKINISKVEMILAQAQSRISEISEENKGE